MNRYLTTKRQALVLGVCFMLTANSYKQILLQEVRS